MMSDDRRKRSLRHEGRNDAEIEAIAKGSVAEFSAQRFIFDDVNPVEAAKRLARTLRPPRDEGPPGSAAGKRTRARL
jgi:hypothetical protein